MSTTKNVRRHIRYKPDKFDTALIMFDGARDSWQPDDVALIIDESASAGAQLLLRNPPPLAVGAVVKVQLGKLEPLSAQVAWCKPLAPDLSRVGIQFLE